MKLSEMEPNPLKTRMQRFMAKVEKTDGCWIWKGAKAGNGYGQFWDGVKPIMAHWFLLEKRPEKGTEACHKCDNRLCVNPDHIFIGTRSDNMRDMFSKGRQNTAPGLLAARANPRKYSKGESNHQSRLTDSDVALIKATKKTRGKGAFLARRFGVSETVISGIWMGSRWGHVIPATEDFLGPAFLLATGRAEL